MIGARCVSSSTTPLRVLCILCGLSLLYDDDELVYATEAEEGDGSCSGSLRIGMP
jgi:hypothetical protein